MGLRCATVTLLHAMLFISSSIPLQPRSAFHWSSVGEYFTFGLTCCLGQASSKTQTTLRRDDGSGKAKASLQFETSSRSPFDYFD